MENLLKNESFRKNVSKHENFFKFKGFTFGSPPFPPTNSSNGATLNAPLSFLFCFFSFKQLITRGSCTKAGPHLWNGKREIIDMADILCVTFTSFGRISFYKFLVFFFALFIFLTKWKNITWNFFAFQASNTRVCRSNFYETVPIFSAFSLLIFLCFSCGIFPLRRLSEKCGQKCVECGLKVKKVYRRMYEGMKCRFFARFLLFLLGKKSLMVI